MKLWSLSWSSVNQAGLELTEACLCLLSAGIKACATTAWFPRALFKSMQFIPNSSFPSAHCSLELASHFGLFKSVLSGSGVAGVKDRQAHHSKAGSQTGSETTKCFMTLLRYFKKIFFFFCVLKVVQDAKSCKDARFGPGRRTQF